LVHVFFFFLSYSRYLTWTILRLTKKSIYIYGEIAKIIIIIIMCKTNITVKSSNFKGNPNLPYAIIYYAWTDKTLWSCLFELWTNLKLLAWLIHILIILAQTFIGFVSSSVFFSIFFSTSHLFIYYNTTYIRQPKVRLSIIHFQLHTHTHTHTPLNIK